MKNKKGLSDIVTTLVVILIALVAIGIIWAVIKNILTKNSEEISIRKFGLINFELKDVKITGCNINLSIQRYAGGEGLEKIMLVFRNSSGAKILEQNITMSELESKSLNFSKCDVSDIFLVEIIDSDSGDYLGGLIDTYEVKNINQSNSTPAPPLIRFMQMSDTHIHVGGSPVASAYDGRTDNCNTGYLRDNLIYWNIYCNTTNHGNVPDDGLYGGYGGSTAPTIALTDAVNAANTYPNTNFVIFTGDIVAQGNFTYNGFPKTTSLDKFESIADNLNSNYYVLGHKVWHDRINDALSLAEYESRFGSINRNFILGNNLFIIWSSENTTYLDNVLDSYKDKNMTLFVFTHMTFIPVFRGNNNPSLQGLMQYYSGKFRAMIFVSGHNHANFYRYRNSTHWISTTATMNYPTEFRIFDIYDNKIQVYMSGIVSPEINALSEALLEGYVSMGLNLTDKKTYYGEASDRNITINLS